MQIDQNSTGWTEAQLALNLEAKTKFQIYAGGDGNLYTSDVYAVPGGGLYYDNGDRLLGDANLNGEIAANDASTILTYILTEKVPTGGKDAMQAMDANDNGEVAANDASTVLTYILTEKGDLGTKKIKDKNNFVNVN